MLLASNQENQISGCSLRLFELKKRLQVLEQSIKSTNGSQLAPVPRKEALAGVRLTEALAVARTDGAVPGVH